MNKQSDVMQIIDQIGELEKPVIPHFAAEWIETCKKNGDFYVSLGFALSPAVWKENNLSDECVGWLFDADNQDLFARAWLDGYSVEQEVEE